MVKHKRTQKERRNSGRETPALVIKGPKEIIINECLDPQPYWNDWEDYRDSYRGANIRDNSKIRYKPRWWWRENLNEIDERNKKLKRLLKRRMAMKNKTQQWSNSNDVSLPTRKTGCDSWLLHTRVTDLSSGSIAG